jgi:hypothetical protein
MVYNEYFVRGTEPRTYCPIHGEYEARAWRVATGRPGEHPVLAEVVQPPGVTGGIVTRPETKSSKRPGFWGRIFKKR